MTVPDVLVSGNHAEIERWRRAVAQQKTRRNRPDRWIRGTASLVRVEAGEFRETSTFFST